LPLAAREGGAPDTMNDILMTSQAVFEKAGIPTGERVG
jgi:hypothetical protein